MDETDDDLMRAFRDGDAEAFATLYARHRVAVYSYLKLHAMGEDAAALFKATWARFVDLRDDALGNGGAAARLFRIAHERVAEARAQLDLPWGDVEPQELADAEDRLRDITQRSRGRALKLRRAIGQLPQTQREAYLLYEAGGLPLPTVAEVEDEEVHVAAQRLKLALRALRNGIDDAGRGGS